METIGDAAKSDFLDSAEKSPNGAADENLLAARLGNGELIFVEVNRLTEISANKFRYEGKFQDVPRRFSQNAANDYQTTIGTTQLADQLSGRNRRAADRRRNQHQ